jgi:hypothetical protein
MLPWPQQATNPHDLFWEDLPGRLVGIPVCIASSLGRDEEAQSRIGRRDLSTTLGTISIRT